MSAVEAKREFAVEVVRRLKDAGFQALWAGGCVRDFLLGREPQDYDVATDARPKVVRKLFGSRRTVAVGQVFGVIIVRGPQGAGQVEVATFRTEGPYLDGRRPEHVAFSSPEEDANRRDFTINGMFYDPIEQKPLDFVGGEKDLSRGIVRAIGDPHDRMREDKLRMLRAVRFAATLDFQLDAATADAVREMAEQIHIVSAERIAQELKRMLVDRQRMQAMRLAEDVGLLLRILPELAPILKQPGADDAADSWEKTLQMLHLLQDPGFELAAAALLHSVAGDVEGRNESRSQGQPEPSQTPAREICRRLRLSNQETDHICWLLAHQHDLRDAPHLPLPKLKRLMGHRLIGDLLAFSRVERLVENADPKAVVFCEEYLRNTPSEEINPPLLLSGDDLIEQGLEPGPHFKQLLTAIRDAQLQGEIRTKEEALKLADRLRTEGETDD